MPNPITLINQLQAWLLALDPVAVGIQIALVGVALGLGLFLKRRLLRFLTQGDGPGKTSGAGHILWRSLERLVVPLGALVAVAALRGLLLSLGLPVGLLNVVIPLLGSLALVRLLIYLLRKSLVSAPLVKAWEHIISTLVWSVLALHLLGWLVPVLDTLDALGVQVGSTRVSLLSTLKLVLLIALLFAVALWVARLIEAQVQTSEHLSRSFKVGIAKFAKFGLLSLALLLALDAVGIDLTALTVFGGALGVGLGFGLQRIASNFISGFILIMDRSIKPGDVISIGDKFGWVEELRARYIVVRNRDGEENLIPNEQLITTEVINWSYSDSNVRVKLPVQISYDNDPEQALAILVEAARACERVLEDPIPTARLIEFGDNGICLELRVWINDPQNGMGNVRTDVNLAIWRAFKEAGISIPYPQRDLHIRRAPRPTPNA